MAKKTTYTHMTQDRNLHQRTTARTYTHVIAVQEPGKDWAVLSFAGSRALADKAATTLRNKLANPAFACYSPKAAVSVEAINGGRLPITQAEVTAALNTMLDINLPSPEAAANVAKVERKAKAMARAAVAAKATEETRNALAKAGSTTKVCRICGERLPLDAFGKNASTTDGLRAFCRSCASTRAKARKAAKAAA